MFTVFNDGYLDDKLDTIRYDLEVNCDFTVVNIKKDKKYIIFNLEKNNKKYNISVSIKSFKDNSVIATTDLILGISKHIHRDMYLV